MSQELPSFNRPRCPVMPSLSRDGRGRSLGWFASTSVAALLVTAVGALAMTTWDSAGEALGAEETAVMVMLPPVPAIEAISEPTPDVSDQAPSEEVLAPDTEDTPDMPELTEAPDVPDDAPEIEEILAEEIPEIETEPPPAPVVEVPKKKEPKKEKKKETKKAEAPKEKAKEPPKKKASEASAAAKKSSQASNAQASTGSGQVSAKSYAASVMKKVKGTRKQRTGERGTAVVSFTISEGGGLAGVRIAKGSGSAAVDQVAMDHIRRSAPFPAPPPGVGRTYSFTFKAN